MSRGRRLSMHLPTARTDPSLSCALVKKKRLTLPKLIEQLTLRPKPRSFPSGVGVLLVVNSCSHQNAAGTFWILSPVTCGTFSCSRTRNKSARVVRFRHGAKMGATFTLAIRQEIVGSVV